jgi:hypothetical protein
VHLVEVVADAGDVVDLQWPVTAHLLEGDPPDKQRVGGRDLLELPQ